jgi:glycosyltransferase involved in cell wall biosynthesis
MKNVVIRAPLLSISGYGVHSRQIFKWLESRKDINIISQIVQWGNTSWMINTDLEDGIVQRIMNTSVELSQKADISFQVQLPDEWDHNLAKINIGISAVVETDKCNEGWISAINKMDAVIVPSNHIRQTCLNSGNVTTKIFVIGEWFYDNILLENDEPLDLNLNTSFNFLSVATFTGNDPSTDRKNLFNTIKWFCESFANDKDVGLVLKTNFGRGTHIDRAITKNTLRSILGEVRKGKFPKVHLVHGNLTSDEVISLYRREDIKCLISLTRGEGFGLPLLEASACGLPIIATNWSAHLDFLNLGKFIPIHYRLIEISDQRIDNRIFFKGFKWADPLEKDFKKKIKKFRNSPDIPKLWASKLSESVRERFSSKEIIKLYNKMISEVLDGGPC